MDDSQQASLAGVPRASAGIVGAGTCLNAQKQSKMRKEASGQQWQQPQRLQQLRVDVSVGVGVERGQ